MAHCGCASLNYDDPTVDRYHASLPCLLLRALLLLHLARCVCYRVVAGASPLDPYSPSVEESRCVFCQFFLFVLQVG